MAALPAIGEAWRNLKDKGSDYAAKGTDAYVLGEYKLKTVLGLPADDPTDSLK